MQTQPQSLLRRSKKNRRVGTRAATPSDTPSPLRSVVAYVAGIVALGGAAVGAVYGVEAVVRCDKLAVKKVAFSGNARATDAELETYTAVRAGDGILSLDLDAIALQLRRHPWVAEAVVRRRLPDEVDVRVTEHVPAMLVSLGDVYLANAEGELFKRVSAADRIVSPVLTGLSRDEASKQPEVSATRVRDAIAIAQTYAKTAVRLGRLDEVHWDEDLGWSLVVSPDGDEQLAFRAHLGIDGVARLPLVMSAVARLKDLKERPKVIWADGDKHPDRVHVSVLESQTSSAQQLIAKAK